MEARRKTHATETRGRMAAAVRSTKVDVAALNRQDVTIVDRYVKNREQHAGEAQPSMEYIDEGCKDPRRLHLLIAC